MYESKTYDKLKDCNLDKEWSDYIYYKPVIYLFCQILLNYKSYDLSHLTTLL